MPSLWDDGRNRRLVFRRGTIMTLHPELSVGLVFVPFAVATVILLVQDAWRTSRLPRVVREAFETRFPGVELCWFDPPGQFTPDIYTLYVRRGVRVNVIRISSDGRILHTSQIEE